MRHQIEKLMADPRRSVEQPRNAGANVTLPRGQYMGQWYGMVTQNQSGWSFFFATSMLDL